MKFFKKRLTKRKLAKSLTETTLITPTTTVHQHDSNKPLPPSPSVISMPPQATIKAKSVEPTNNDSWLELNLPNDFSSSFDLPQLQQHQSQATSSNKLEISTEKSSPQQELENITETSLLSYPNNHIDTTTHNEANTPESVGVMTAALTPTTSCSTPDPVDGDTSQQEESPLQPVEKQGGDLLLNDTFSDANVLANATLIPTDTMQHVELEEKDDLLEMQRGIKEEQVEETAVASDTLLAVSTSASTCTASNSSLTEQITENATLAGQEVELPDSSLSAEEKNSPTQTPVDMRTMDNEDVEDLLIAAPLPPTTSSSPSETAPLVKTEPAPAQAVPALDVQKDVTKIAKRKSAISLIPRKQPLMVDANVKKDGRRASSSSFIPVLATRHQHQNATLCSTPSKDVLTTTTTEPVTWSPSSSSERNSVSSDSASSCGSQHQEKRTSLTVKSSATQQQLLQSKIPKAAFGVPFTASATAEISKMPLAQQHVSRLPTKRNSTLA